MPRDRVRPDPVSCQTCRFKKLKCNRAQPCSNCIARNITCHFLVPPPQERPDTISTLHSNAEILARLERLESVVLKPTSPSHTHSKYASEDIHSSRQQPRYSGLESVIESSIHQRRDQDSRLLEDIGTREDSLYPHLLNRLVFKINSTHEIIAAQTCLQHSASVSNNRSTNEIIVTIPIYEIAILLFHIYESNMDHLCHILHIPSLRALMKTFYLRINQSQSVLPGQAALLLSIFAIATYFYQPFESSEIATSKRDSINLYKILSQGALDVLEYSYRNSPGTLEDVQAYILTSFVAYHLDSLSTKGRLLLATAASIARELRLHRLDAGGELAVAENEASVRILIDREVRRRVFWHIASTDWLLSTVSGPQEGTYLIHPNHVHVRPPKDCSDDDLVLGEENELTIGPQPSSMSFFLERLRLAHLCREMTDTVPLETSELTQMPFEQIIALDKKLQDFISNLPFFFKIDAESRRRSKPFETVCPRLPVLRYFIITEAHSKRCKLHQRFLHRQSFDPRYDYSRRACIESARAVVQVYKDLREHSAPSTVMELMPMAVHFTHLALVVMVMDLCFNRDEAEEPEIKAEVNEALQMFGDSSSLSPLLGRFLNSLKDVLWKHKVHLTDPLALAAHNVANFADDIMLDTFNNRANDDEMQSTLSGPDMVDPSVPLSTSFDEFWQIAMQGEPNLDLLTWDNLFSTLDSQSL